MEDPADQLYQRRTWVKKDGKGGLVALGWKDPCTTSILHLPGEHQSAGRRAWSYCSEAWTDTCPCWTEELEHSNLGRAWLSNLLWAGYESHYRRSCRKTWSSLYGPGSSCLMAYLDRLDLGPSGPVFEMLGEALFIFQPLSLLLGLLG